MSNIKVSMRRALAPARSEYQVSKVMTVTSVKALGSVYATNMIGYRSKMTKLLSTLYAVGDKLIVSEGEVIGRTQEMENTFYI